MDKAEILGFIQNFKGSKDVFLNGCCYWFAFILVWRQYDVRACGKSLCSGNRWTPL